MRPPTRACLAVSPQENSSPNNEPLGGSDWLDDAWQAMPDRWDTIVERRLAGDTLDRIADVFDLTRERIRQLQQKAEGALVDAQRSNAPDLPRQITETLADHPAVPEDQLAALLPSRASTARQALFRQLGASRPRTWSGDLPRHWTRRPAALDTLVRKLVALAPMTDAETHQAILDIGLPAHLRVDDLLENPESKLTHHRLGWIRTARTGRDLAYLWLRGQGEPRAVADIAAVTGTSEHAIRETMRRDDDFAQVRPEGTWALADWRLPGADNRYSNAVDVVVDVLRDHGPLDYEQLRTETQHRYPVSSWRITQCLSSDVIGLTSEGLYDLAERGATPIEDPEPKQPKTIQVHGNVLGVELNVDSEMLRGSGIAVNRWLTWYLGLRTAPSTRYFGIAGQPGTVTVKRATSSSQLSSLRAVAQNMDLVEGCKMAVLLHLDTETATIRHTCQDDACPAK